jgi:formate dehydrogenase major subunit
MGIWEKMNPAFRANLEREFNFKTPENDGLNTVESIAAMRDGRVKAFFAMGGNFAVASPDTESVASGLQSCDLTVQVITKLNRTALLPGKTSLILPCLGRSEIDRQAEGEQFVSTESTMLNVQLSKGIFEPASENLRSEAVDRRPACKGHPRRNDGCRLGTGLPPITTTFALRSHVLCRVARITMRRIREPGGFYMPNPPSRGEFETQSERAVFESQPSRSYKARPRAIALTTVRSHDQFNTTIYGFDDRYRGIDGDRHVIFMNEGDIEIRGFRSGQAVDITSHFGDGERTAKGFRRRLVSDTARLCGCIFSRGERARPT